MAQDWKEKIRSELESKSPNFNWVVKRGKFIKWFAIGYPKEGK